MVTYFSIVILIFIYLFLRCHLRKKIPKKQEHSQKTTLKSPDNVEHLARQVPFFSFLSTKQFALFFEECPRRHYKKGEIIDDHCVVLDGEVEISYHGIVLDTRTRGCLLNGGIELFLSQHKLNSKICISTALTNTEVLLIKKFEESLILEMMSKVGFQVCTSYLQQSDELIEYELKYFYCGIFHRSKLKRKLMRTLSRNEILKTNSEELEIIMHVEAGELVVDTGTKEHLISSGGEFGYFNACFGSARDVTITATRPTTLSTIRSNEIVTPDPNAIAGLPEIIRLADASCEWIRLQPGDLLTEKGDRAHCAYFIDSGKVNALDAPSLTYGSGESLGDRECLVNGQWGHTFLAVKTTDVIRIPKQFLEYVLEKEGKFCLRFTKRIIEERKENRRGHNKGKIVTILPSGNNFNVPTLALQLKNIIGPSCLFLTNRSIYQISKTDTSLIKYLSEQEKKYSIILFYVENMYSRLFEQLLKFSDVLLLVGDELANIPRERIFCSIEMVHLCPARKETKPIGFKITQLDIKSLFRKENIDLKRHFSRGKEKLRRLLKPAASEEFVFNRIHKILINGKIGDSTNLHPLYVQDIERLARSLLGFRVGLVLGGGGARGFAHLGVIRALEEEGIPIDCVGGTSMGAFVGALYARECDIIGVYRDAKKFSRIMSSKWHQLIDLTWPICSLFTGHTFNSALKSLFGSDLIQHLWIEYFCISTDISVYEELVHRIGTLWRYVRASMSLSGYLPPLYDGGRLLVDGGYMNNVPVDVMLRMGVSTVVAVDVGSILVNDYDDFGDSLSGFHILWHRWFGKRRYLSNNEIQYRLAFVGSQNKMRDMEKWVNDGRVLLIRPELDEHTSMDFKGFDKIVNKGYYYTKEIIKGWKMNGVYKSKFGSKPVFKKRRYSI
ncbi:Lysophospholipase NTE1 [Astathelohania contejeani]|uniref:Lysophospholipase NTE1 n=1 Tax=Astathelohania contejeani TaxID=164912 RepID=A0ABQ7I002_9MICR|nr:Lysophospholipase NTE1 [Thelohania contejeani]